MQIETPSKSKSLLGVTDLTLAAPLKRGLIPALDARSYESRLRLLLRTLNTLRVSSLEVQPTPLIKDAVDRIRAIHSFRLAIVGEEPFKQLVLAVAFDGGWEPYMRRIWRDLGPLLDVIFCNCEGYLLAHSHSFAAYAGWVRSAQVGTEFFYVASGLTVNDLHYLRATARASLRGEEVPVAAADDDAPAHEVIEEALPALTALYRLTDMYPPASALPSFAEQHDGEVLWRAARHLLFRLAQHDKAAGRYEARTPIERAALEWFTRPQGTQPNLPQAPTQLSDASRAQGGIVHGHRGLTHGCLLLVSLRDAAAAQALIKAAQDMDAASTGEAAAPFVNVGLTYQGLHAAGLPAATLEQFPVEFREGMEARAGILGDVLTNHPTCWPLPQRNWPHRTPERVQLSSVHAIVQLSAAIDGGAPWQDLPDDEHPLQAAIWRLHDAAINGVTILSVQAMQRYPRPGERHPRDHFGFPDGISQPVVDEPGKAGRDVVPAGDVLLGYGNSLGDDTLSGRLWDDSTFLVIRKLRQDVEALDEALADVADPERAKALMMGRWTDGKNLIDETDGNDFDYDMEKSPSGSQCPFNSHIRRANPRKPRDDINKVPRILRRGMSYGPRDGNTDERGVIFMAYCASVAEQFEVIQGWLAGSNSGGKTGGDTYSALRDPLVGVCHPDDPQVFVHRSEAGEVRVPLRPERPFVRLQWGVYLFVPSKRALEEIRQIAEERSQEDQKRAREKGRAEETETKRAASSFRPATDLERAVLAQKGAAVIAKLQFVERTMGPETARLQWKIVLEDLSARMSGVSRAVWTAIRELNGGSLRTPYGVLVGSKALVTTVFTNEFDDYTVSGYAKRMKDSFGTIYLGLDRTDEYSAQADGPNEAIREVSEECAFDAARQAVLNTVDDILPDDEERTLDVKDVVDGVLARLSRHWFGVPDGTLVVSGGWHWRPDDLPPTCPGHFHSPSRYMFQPHPGPEAADAGQRHGRALLAAVTEFVAQHRLTDTLPDAPLGKALFEAYEGKDAALLASTLIGVMMGFLPTVDGNLRGLLYEWVNDRSLWDHEIAYRALGPNPRFDAVDAVLREPLRRTLQLRPVPELTWRIAKKQHALGPVQVQAGDLVVVGIVSAMHEELMNATDDLYPLFGGKRKGDSANPPPPPLHACPGYRMAMGVMLGTLAGLLDAADLQPTLSPMALRVRRRERVAEAQLE